VGDVKRCDWVSPFVPTKSRAHAQRPLRHCGSAALRQCGTAALRHCGTAARGTIPQVTSVPQGRQSCLSRLLLTRIANVMFLLCESSEATTLADVVCVRFCASVHAVACDRHATSSKRIARCTAIEQGDPIRLKPTWSSQGYHQVLSPVESSSASPTSSASSAILYQLKVSEYGDGREVVVMHCAVLYGCVCVYRSEKEECAVGTGWDKKRKQDTIRT